MPRINKQPTPPRQAATAARRTGADDVLFFPSPLEGDEDLGGEKVRRRRPYVRAAVQLDDDWVVAYRLIPQDGDLVVGEIRIFPGKQTVFSDPEPDEEAWSKPLPRGGFTTRALREIRMGQHLRAAQRQAAEAEGVFGGAFRRFRWPLSSDKPQPGKRRQRDELFYAQVADEYVNALQAGSHKPVADVAAASYYSTAHIRDAVFKARDKGLLTPAPRGRSGGRLTDKARKLLERAASERLQDRIIKAKKA